MDFAIQSQATGDVIQQGSQRFTELMPVTDQLIRALEDQGTAELDAVITAVLHLEQRLYSIEESLRTAAHQARLAQRASR